MQSTHDKVHDALLSGCDSLESAVKIIEEIEERMKVHCYPLAHPAETAASGILRNVKKTLLYEQRAFGNRNVHNP